MLQKQLRRGMEREGKEGDEGEASLSTVIPTSRFGGEWFRQNSTRASPPLPTTQYPLPFTPPILAMAPLLSLSLPSIPHAGFATLVMYAGIDF